MKNVLETLSVLNADEASNIFHQASGNLFLVKNSAGEFSLMFSDVLGAIETEFKNLKFTQSQSLKVKIHGRSGFQYLQNCVFINATNSLDSFEFVKAISGLLEKTDREDWGARDILDMIRTYQEIVAKDEKRKEEVIGVWGELYVLNLLLKNEAAEHKVQILNGWEGRQNRTLHDFNLSETVVLEVKTSAISDQRIHHFNGISQLIAPSNGVGYVVSVLLLHDSSGRSCHEIQKEICEHLGSERLIQEFKARIRVRGDALCNDKHLRFSVNKFQVPKIYPFGSVPRPDFIESVCNVKFDVIFDNLNGGLPFWSFSLCSDLK